MPSTSRAFQNQVPSGPSLLAAGFQGLIQLLGDDLTVKLVDDPERFGEAGDALVVLADSSGTPISERILVEARSDLQPAAVRQLVPRLELMRRLIDEGDAVVLVISPWLSPRTRQVLDEHGFSYLDLTGNVSVRLKRPRVIVRTEGAQQGPAPEQRAGRSLAGDKAGTLVRALIDVRPPYRAADLADATGLGRPYVSRLLETMDRQALIKRDAKVITGVAWRALLEARSRTGSLLRTAHVVPMVCPQGPDRVLSQLANSLGDVEAIAGRVAVTGPQVAYRAPLVIGGQLMIYIERDGDVVVEGLQKPLWLAPPVRSIPPNVLLLVKPNPVVYVRREIVGDVPVPSISQLTIDCLTGNGRMPQQGEALLDWMSSHEAEWRLSDLAEWDRDGDLLANQAMTN